MRAKEDTYFATLSRGDYKAILQTTFERLRQERNDFLSQMPLFLELSTHSINKISAMLQQRVVIRNEAIFDFDAPVLQIYLARQGQYAVCDRLRPRVAVHHDAVQDVLHATEEKEHDKGGPLLKPKSMTIALLEAPTMFGLSNYLNGERKYTTKVVCQSSQGTIYCIIAKELANHLSREQRIQLHRSCETENRFHENRLRVLRKVGAPMDHLHGLHVNAWGLDCISSGRFCRLCSVCGPASDCASVVRQSFVDCVSVVRRLGFSPALLIYDVDCAQCGREGVQTLGKILEGRWCWEASFTLWSLECCKCCWRVCRLAD